MYLVTFYTITHHVGRDILHIMLYYAPLFGFTVPNVTHAGHLITSTESI